MAGFGFARPGRLVFKISKAAKDKLLRPSQPVAQADDRLPGNDIKDEAKG